MLWPDESKLKPFLVMNIIGMFGKKMENAYGKSIGFSVKYGSESLMLCSCFVAGGPMALLHHDSAKYQDISV